MEPGPVQRLPAAGTTQVRGRAARAASPASCSPSRVSSQVHFWAVSSGSRALLEALLPLWGVEAGAVRGGQALQPLVWGPIGRNTVLQLLCVQTVLASPVYPGPEGRASP